MATQKKKVHPGLIELDPEDAVVVVNYETHDIEIDSDGTQRVVGRTPGIKQIKIRPLPNERDIPQVAQELTKKCRLISASKVGRVEELLHELVERESMKPGPSSSQSSAAYVHGFSEVDRQQLWQRNQDRPATASRQHSIDTVRLEDLDIYIENLYEDDVKDKARAANCIASLFRQAQHLEPLLSHATLLPTLARVLRDDGKRSVDLCVGIQSVWLVLSNFSQFHQLLVENQVGVLTIDILDLEIKRTEHRVKEEGVSIAAAAVKEAQGLASEKERRLLAVTQKQDKLLYLCAYLLLNLSEDPDIERKMQKKGTVVYLVKMLDRTNIELLILSTAFLKKLSIYQENKDQMAACDVVPRLVTLMATDNDVLLMAVLRLLHNLSFDRSLKDEMVKQGLLPKAVQLVRQMNFQQVALSLLYHISQDDRHKSMFIYTDAVTVMLDLLMHVDDLTTTPELIALAVNLTQNDRIAEALCGGDRLAMLLERAFLTRDELLFKVLRNLSQQTDLGIKGGFLPYMDQLAHLLQGSLMGIHDAVPLSTTLGPGFQTPMHVSSLYIYPIKACKGCEVPRAIVETTGFAYDRYWMIVTEAEGRFVTQRQDARLALIGTQLPQDACILGSKGHPDPKAALTLSGPGMPDVQVPLQPKSDPTWRSVRCHDWKGDAIDEGNEVADWLSEFLQQRVRLVKYGGVPGSAGLDEDSHRRSSAKGWYTGGQSETAFSDAFPFLVTCQASLHDLNTHLDIPISMNRFRPNIVLDGEQPAWAEDQWGNRSICIRTQEGTAVDLEMCKPCSRCTVPLVEQETAERGSQPILAMKDFRLGKHLGFDKFGKYADTPVYRGGAVNNTTFFGWDAVPVQLGSVIAVGDAVTVKGGNAALAYDAVTGRTSVVQQWFLLLSLRDAAALCTLLVVTIMASWLAYSLTRGFSHEPST